MEKELESLRARIEREVVSVDSEEGHHQQLQSFAVTRTATDAPLYSLGKTSAVATPRDNSAIQKKTTNKLLNATTSDRIGEPLSQGSTFSKPKERLSLERRPSLVYKLPSKKKAVVSGIEMRSGEGEKLKLSLDVQLKPTGEPLQEHEQHFRN